MSMLLYLNSDSSLCHHKKLYVTETKGLLMVIATSISCHTAHAGMLGAMPLLATPAT